MEGKPARQEPRGETSGGGEPQGSNSRTRRPGGCAGKPREAGSTPAPSATNEKRKDMEKRQTEEAARRALRALRQIIEGTIDNVGYVLDSYEAAHNDYELTYSKEYAALVAGFYGLTTTLCNIDKQIDGGKDADKHKNHERRKDDGC